jgi:hypothetical protein
MELITLLIMNGQMILLHHKIFKSMDMDFGIDLWYTTQQI